MQYIIDGFILDTKKMFSVFVAIIVVVGIYFGYQYYLTLSTGVDLNYCSENFPDKPEVSYSDQTTAQYIFQTCPLEVCKKYQEDFVDQIDDLDFDEKTVSEIDAQCYNLCAAFNVLLDCTCNNCRTCHQDCGKGYQTRCEENLSCGTDEYRTYTKTRK